MNTPQLFPPNDKSYLEFNGIGERATEIWHYTNKNGQTMFLKYRRDFINKETKEPNRDYLPVSRINDQWDKHLNWQGNLPLYKVHELLTTKKPILIVEGEWACSSAQKLLPDYFVTTWSGGCRNWRSTNWKTLKDKKDITFWPDNDETGLNSIQHITRWLSDRINAESKIVKIPNGLPEKWDLADLERKKIGDDIDIRKLLREAEPVKKYNYEDIATDIENKRWVYLKKSRKLYWDKYKKTFEHKDTINELYLRDYDLKRQATKELHKQDIEVCDRTAFWPTDEERLYEDGLVYLNVYKRKQFPPLKTNTTKEDVEPFRNHLRILSNGDEIAFNLLEDTIAHDLQRPEVNRIWAILIQGLEGVGKSVLFEVMTKLLGENNVAWVSSTDIVDRFRGWLRTCSAIVCNEFNFGFFNNPNTNTYGKLHELMSETKHRIEQKGIDTDTHKGHYKIWLSTNKSVPIRLSPTDRRFVVLKCFETPETLEAKDPNYYKDIWAFVDEEEKVKQLFWYYKSVHQISENFNPRKPIMTDAKKHLIIEGQDQVFRDLDVMFEKKEGPFARALVNSNSIMDWVRNNYSNGMPNARLTLIHKINQSKITEWINYRKGVPIKKGQAKAITPDEIKQNRKRHYWAIRNQDYWKDCEDLKLIREHMEEKIEVLTTRQEQLALDDNIPF